MEEDKISHPKIAIKTFLSVIVMALIIFAINSWPNLKLSLNGNTPPLKDWMFYISKTSTLVSLFAFGIFFYYRNWASQKEAIKNQKEIEAKHQSWLDAE